MTASAPTSAWITLAVIYAIGFALWGLAVWGYLTRKRK